MAINKKRDFKKLSVCIQEFLSRLPCDENTGFLRDTLYLSLLELHKYYIKEKDRLGISLHHSSEGALTTDVLKHVEDKYQSRWDGYKEVSNETESQGFVAAHLGDIENLKNVVYSDDADPFGQTYLMYTVRNSGSHQIECIQYILSLNFDINSQANDGATALHVACQYDKKEAIVELLKNKADPTIQDNKGRAPLHWAVFCSPTGITKLLLQYGADINVKDCDAMTPIMWSCHFNKVKNMHVLKNEYERLHPTKPEAIFNNRDNTGRTLLHCAVGNKYGLTCLKDLLRCDISHVRDNQGRTVLHTAAKEGCVSACELVLNECDKEILNVKDNENQTALHLATLCGHGETVDFLLRFGANISIVNNSGRTALEEAEFGHYHYCLLVFAAFEQIKCEEKEKIQQEEVEDKKTKRYESWVIPTGFLHDSQEAPDVATTNDESKVLQTPLTPEQLVDVSEIKGFEVNEDNTQTNERENTRLGNVPRSNSNQTATLQRGQRIEEEKKDKLDQSNNWSTDKDQDIISNDKAVSGIDEQKAELLEYSGQYLQQHGSVSSMVSSVSSESENIDISSLGNDETDEDNELECKENEKEEKNTSQAKTDTTKNERPPYFPESKPRRGGNLAPITGPLTQPSFGLPSKLNPIPQHITNKKGLNGSENGVSLPRGIVSPLQPPSLHGGYQNDQPVFQVMVPSPESNGSPAYEQRGPGHGPLAHTHGKALLNNVYQDSSKIREQKTPETQRRTTKKKNRSGRQPHPPRN